MADKDAMLFLELYRRWPDTFVAKRVVERATYKGKVNWQKAWAEFFVEKFYGGMYYAMNKAFGVKWNDKGKFTEFERGLAAGHTDGYNEAMGYEEVFGYPFPQEDGLVYSGGYWLGYEQGAWDS